MTATPFSRARPRSYGLAALCGALVPMVIGASLLIGWISVAQFRGGPSSPSPFELVALFFVFLLQSALVAFPTACLLIGPMALLERRRPRPLALWLLLGLVATTPFAALVWLVSHMGDCFQNCRTISEWEYAVPALIVYGCGLIGALVARRVRHGAWA